MIGHAQLWLQRRLLNSEFARHVLTLVAGTGVAQLLPVLASPLLTRLFTPQQFGEFGLFWALSALLAMVATGRYEQAILLPAEDQPAFHVASLSLLVTTGFSLLCMGLTAALWLLPLPDGYLQNRSWLSWVAPMTWSLGTHQVLTYWFNRKEEYGRLGANRVWRAVLMVGLSLALGLAGWEQGLVAGACLAQLFATAQLAHGGWRQYRSSGLSGSREELFEVARRYRRFAIFSTPGDALNAATCHLPTFVLASYFGPFVAGQYSLTQRVLAGPVSILARAVGDVFRQRASVDLQRQGNCRDLWLQMCRMLLTLSVPLYLALALTSPLLFRWVFGEPWRTAGYYAQLLVPFFMLSFTASILGRMTQIAEKQLQDLLWQIVLFVAVAGSLGLGVWLEQPAVSIAMFSASYSVMYGVYLLLSYRYASDPERI